VSPAKSVTLLATDAIATEDDIQALLQCLLDVRLPDPELVEDLKPLRIKLLIDKLHLVRLPLA
jgi:hypothetical protein